MRIYPIEETLPHTLPLLHQINLFLDRIQRQDVMEKCHAMSNINNIMGDKYCSSGCAPVAVAILYGYHDNHDFPEILTQTEAPMHWDENDISMRIFINLLRFTMETVCGIDY